MHMKGAAAVLLHHIDMPPLRKEANRARVAFEETHGAVKT
jgi:hypothetical protein